MRRNRAVLIGRYSRKQSRVYTLPFPSVGNFTSHKFHRRCFQNVEPRAKPVRKKTYFSHLPILRRKHFSFCFLYDFDHISFVSIYRHLIRGSIPRTSWDANLLSFEVTAAKKAGQLPGLPSPRKGL